MPKQREGTKRILNWEELERAPNTVGAYSFLRPVAEVINIRGATIGLVQTKKKPYIIRASARVQDGHSTVEHALLVALWKAGEEQQDGTKTKTIGW